MFKVDSPFPSFSLEIYNAEKGKQEKISNETFNSKWLILFFYPGDFTFVCPTELVDMNARINEFKKSGAEVIGISTDSVYSHKAWIEAEEQLKELKYSLASDHNGNMSRALDIYEETDGTAQRACFIIDPDGMLRAADIVSDPIGRSAGEILRKLKALKFVRENPGKVCPASWDEGLPVITKSMELSGKVLDELEKNK
ncbi:peroxiredoxin [Candidatus Giovannonibacteria bacterium]|nr:peroxiredoxin [Candidatus Giovannonibacteria bacterium]